ncbi:MAG: hypothetical protein RL685_72 [Pseudomonadota bacterium]|jgi:hypothetical protein
MCTTRAKRVAPARWGSVRWLALPSVRSLLTGRLLAGRLPAASLPAASLLAASLLAASLLTGSLLTGCGEGESTTWVGIQDCAVGIPPQTMRGGELASVQLPLVEALVTPLGSGFSIRKFTLGPIGGSADGEGGFSCEADQVTARFVSAPVSSPSSAGATPLGATSPVGRALELVPFQCRGGDGRMYTLDGEGQGDQDALFFSQTFTAWLGAERATLVCSTRFQRQVVGDSGGVEASADAGVVPFGPSPN